MEEAELESLNGTLDKIHEVATAMGSFHVDVKRMRDHVQALDADFDEVLANTRLLRDEAEDLELLQRRNQELTDENFHLREMCEILQHDLDTMGFLVQLSDDRVTVKEKPWWKIW